MRALAFAVALIVACGSHDAPPDRGSGSGTASAAPAPPTSPSKPADKHPAPAVDACAAMNRAFDDARAHASGACATDADCDCFPGGLGATPDCGGVTDRKSAAALDAIADAFAEQRCNATIACAASVCSPHCEAGRCR